jgi:hypothetical protein
LERIFHDNGKKVPQGDNDAATIRHFDGHGGFNGLR